MLRNSVLGIGLCVGACASSSTLLPTMTSVDGTDFTALDIKIGDVDTTAYLSPSVVEGSPLLLLIQGSGCDSVFRRNPTGSLQGTAGQDVLAQLSNGRSRVVVVEKPHVALGQNKGGGGLSDCSDAFRADHSLENWTHALGEALDSVKTSLDLDGGDVRVLGLSEGAVTAARLASLRDDISHVAFIGGHGCHQLDDMIVTARRNWLQRHPDATTEEKQAGAAEAMEASETVIASIAETPTDTSADIWGQTALFWSTFGTACPARDLADADADVFVAYGTEDEQVVADGVEEIVSRRILAGRPVEAVRIVGGNHVLQVQGDTSPFARMIDVFQRALDWMQT